MPRASRQSNAANFELMPAPANENAERILQQAWAMFQQYGFRGTSVDELCRRCDLTKPTLYHYFGNKETLYIHVMLRQLQGYRVIMQTDGPLRQRLVELAQAILASFDTDINSMMRDMAHVKDARLHDVMAQAFRRELFEPLMRAIRDDIQPSAHVDHRAEFYAWLFLGIVNTFVSRRTASESRGTAREPQLLAPQLVDFFYHGAHDLISKEE